MSTEDKLQELFHGLVASGNPKGMVEEVYKCMPWADSAQQAAYLRLLLLSEKHNLPGLKAMVSSYRTVLETNRPLGMTFKRLIEAVALRDFLKDFKGSQVGTTSINQKG